MWSITEVEFGCISVHYGILRQQFYWHLLQPTEQIYQSYFYFAKNVENSKIKHPGSGDGLEHMARRMATKSLKWTNHYRNTKTYIIAG